MGRLWIVDSLMRHIRALWIVYNSTLVVFRYDTLGKNLWYYVEVSVADSGNMNHYLWSNKAGRSWRMTRTNEKSKLTLGPDCPYFHTEPNRRHVEIIRDHPTGVRALKFLGKSVCHPIVNSR